jgi:8-oxo-dGTP diphosphatase
MARVHVAVGVVCDEADRVLITKRHPGSHQGGLWEFPGGKLEPGEEVLTALRRELLEELGIHLDGAQSLLEVEFDYPDKQVLLDVWRVQDFSGTAVGREGQPLKWVPVAKLGDYEFPAANRPIVEALARSLPGSASV